MDLVLENSRTKQLTIIEIKYSTNAAPTRGFYSASQDLQPQNQYVIVPEGEAWQRKESVVACGLRWFLVNELPKIM